MPGFPELLAALRDAGAALGLATGNFSEGARLKLEFYDIDGYFRGPDGLLGGFGEVSLHRGDVVASAITALTNGTRPNPRTSHLASRTSQILVVGDTPHDITSALENGALGIGVATGNYTTEELRDAGAHVVFQDFSDWQSAAEALLTLTV
jgi:phosphoglycolate phosphatase-like HAD superfamily hydrolase